jgi:hypothetical protein
MVVKGLVTKSGLELDTRVRNETDAPAMNDATELDLSPYPAPGICRSGQAVGDVEDDCIVIAPRRHSSRTGPSRSTT